MKKTLGVFTVAFLVLSVFATYSAPYALADWFIDQSSTLIKVDPRILGDDIDNSGDNKDETKIEEPEVRTSDTPRPSSTPSNELTKHESERQLEATKKSQEKARENLKKQTEARKKLNEQKGRSSTFTLHSDNGKLKVSEETKNEAGAIIKKSETEIENEPLHVEQADGSKLEINQDGEGKLELVKNKIKTHTELNLKVDEKNEIAVTLPNGKTKSISLPDKALTNLVSKGIITENPEVENQYTLTAGQNGEPVYQVDGQVEKKFLGIFKVKFAQKVDVAASSSDDGSVVAGDIVSTESQEVSPWRKFLESLSK